MSIKRSKSGQVLRRGQFQREMQAANSIHGHQTAQALGQYHTRFIEPRLRIIEWMLVLPGLWQLGKYLLKKAERMYQLRQMKKAKQAAEAKTAHVA